MKVPILKYNNLYMIDRDSSKTKANKELKKKNIELKDAVNFAIRVLSLSFPVKTTIEKKDEPVFYLYFHIIENADAIDELLNEGCVVPAIIQVRSIYESYLQLLYILDSDNTEGIEKKSKVWLKNTLEIDKKRVNSLNEEEFPEKGKTLEKIDKDLCKLDKDFPIIIDEEFKKNTKELYNHFDERKNDNKSIVYEIYKNKKDSFLSDYLILYHKWSEYSHAQSRGFFTSSPGEIPKFRDISELDNIYDFTIHILISSSHLIINHKRSNDQALVREYDELSRRWNNEIKYRNGG